MSVVVFEIIEDPLNIDCVVGRFCISSESVSSPKKSPGSQLHAHFFPQQYSQERVEPGDITIETIGGPQLGDSSNDSPRRMYVREQFTHENTVRGNVTDSSDGIIRR